MNRLGATAIKVIVAFGVIAFATLYFVGFVLQRAARPVEAERVIPNANRSPFDGARAYRDLETIVGFGPRVAGSKESGELRSFIRSGLETAGLEVFEWSFDAATPLGRKAMVNVVGVVKGTRPELLILGNHYDTKYFPDFSFLGANDGGATTAWMMEMARTLGPSREGRTLWLCFFDGEEAFEEWSARDSLYGSRAFVKRLRENDELSLVGAMINVDMIGDCYLGVVEDADAPIWLGRILRNKAGELGYRNHFLSASLKIEDDHLPFRQAGIPSINLIDFRYGGSLFDHRKNWHTSNDTIDRVCPESLQAVGDVIYHILPTIDGYLDSNAITSREP